MNDSPHITFMLQYTEANAQYIDYTNRSEAVEIANELDLENKMQEIEGLTKERIQEIKETVPEQGLNFKEYVDYMNRSYATERQTEEITAVFTQDTNHLQRSRINDLKDKLQQAYQNGSLLWQGVLSFDNQFLANQGLYNKETGKVDQQALKNVIREAMPKLIQQEGLSDSSFWWGNIHLNTNNIHVHIGLSEVDSQREKIYYASRKRWEYKGNFSQKTIRNLKSQVLHGLLNEETRSLHLRKEQLLANLRTDLLANVLKKENISLSAEKSFLEQAYYHLPKGKRWRYGSHAKDFAISKFFLDRYLDSYLQNDGKELYEAFLAETQEFLKEFESSYSAGREKSYEKIRKVDGRLLRTKMKTEGYDIEKLIALREQDLRERLGNRVLKVFKETAPDFKPEESNLKKFSKRNQVLACEQFPEVSLIYTEKQWKLKGYKLLEDVDAIQIYQPTYKKYDELGGGIGEAEFKPEKYYDILQVERDEDSRGMALRDLRYLSKDELIDLIETGKQSSDSSPHNKQELGIYRYALRLRNLEEDKASLQVVQQLLEQIAPLEMDKGYVDFKQKEIRERLELINLQFTPTYKLSDADKEKKQDFALKYVDSVTLPVDDAHQIAVQIPMDRLREELELSRKVKDEQIFSLIKGGECSKQEYQKELEVQLVILQLKHQIYLNNQALEKEKDSERSIALKKENAQFFSQLKNYYKELSGESEQSQEKMTKLVSKQLQARKEQQKQQLQGHSRHFRASSHFMKGLSSMLGTSERSKKRALMQKARDDEKEEEKNRLKR